jgi:toxin HigB-1
VQDDGVIENFKHKGLAQFFEDDDRRKLSASQIAKIGRILARLNEAMTVQDMGLPGYRLHPLKGELAGFWSVILSGNWRIIFRFENDSATMWISSTIIKESNDAYEKPSPSRTVGTT